MILRLINITLTCASLVLSSSISAASEGYLSGFQKGSILVGTLPATQGSLVLNNGRVEITSKLFKAVTDKDTLTQSEVKLDANLDNTGLFSVQTMCEEQFSLDTQTFADAGKISNFYCAESAKYGDVNYCKCIASKTAIQKKNDPDYTSKIKTRKLSSSKDLHNTLKAKVLSDAVFQYINTSQVVGMGKLSNDQLDNSLAQSQQLSCGPGTLKNLIEDATQGGCYEESSSFANLLDNFNQENKELFKNFDFIDSRTYRKSLTSTPSSHFNSAANLHRNKNAKDFIDSFVADAEASVENQYIASAKSVNYLVNQKYVARPYHNIEQALSDSESKVSKRLSNISYMLISAQSIEKDEVCESNAQSFASVYNDLFDSLKVSPLINDVIDKKSYKDANVRIVRESDNSVIAGDRPVPAFSLVTPIMRPCPKSAQMSHTNPHIVKAKGIQRVVGKLLSNIRKKLGKKEGEFVSAEQALKGMNLIRAQKAQDANNKCLRTFSKLKQLCSTGQKGVFIKGIKDPRSLTEYANILSHGKNGDEQDTYLALGDLYCAYGEQRKHHASGTLSAQAKEILSSDFSESDVEVNMIASEGYGEFSADDPSVTGEPVASAFEDVRPEDIGTVTDSSLSDTQMEEVESDFNSLYKDNNYKPYDYNSNSGVNNFSNLGASPSNNFSSYSLDTDEEQQALAQDLEQKAKESIQENSPSQMKAISDMYDKQIAELQQKLSQVSSKLDKAEEEKNSQEIAKLNQAIESATSTIEKLKSDREVLANKLEKQNSSQSVASTKASNSNFNKISESDAVIKSSGANSSVVNKASSQKALSSNAPVRSPGTDRYGFTSDDYLIKLRNDSMESSQASVLTLTSLSDPAISEKVKTAFKSGNKMIYANVDGAVYRIVPQLDDQGNIIEKNGEIQYITEVVGNPLDKGMDDKKKGRSIASEPEQGIEEKGKAGDDVKFGYDTMMNLTDEALK